MTEELKLPDIIKSVADSLIEKLSDGLYGDENFFNDFYNKINREVEEFKKQAEFNNKVHRMLARGCFYESPSELADNSEVLRELEALERDIDAENNQKTKGIGK